MTEKMTFSGSKTAKFDIGFSGKLIKNAIFGQKCNKKKGHFDIGFSGIWGVLF